MTEQAPRRAAIVTGGGRGIGRASALRLARSGRDVVIADIGDFAADVIPEIEALGQRAIFVKTDVSQKASVQALVAATLETFGRLDILVNCAGILGVEKPFLEQTDEDWERVMGINFYGTLYCCQEALPHMLKQQWGRIVTITSGARRGAAHVPPYGVSKAAVLSLMKAIGSGYCKQGVLANCVEPGRALTDMVVPRFSAEYLANPPGVPMGRYSDADEVAVVINYLCSEENTYTSAANWRVNGGGR